MLFKLFMLGLLFSLTLSQSSDEAQIRQAILGYVDGLYEADSKKIALGVDVTLRKYGFGYSSRDNRFSSMGREMNFKQLSSLADRWNKDGKVDPKTAIKEIIIYDIMDKIASAKLNASWGSDYFHLVKENDEWKIINAAWQSKKPTN